MIWLLAGVAATKKATFNNNIALSEDVLYYFFFVYQTGETEVVCGGFEAICGVRESALVS